VYIYFNGDYLNENYYAQWVSLRGATQSEGKFNYPLIASLAGGGSLFCYGKLKRTPDGLPRWYVQGTRYEFVDLEIFETGGYWITPSNVTSIRIHSTVTGGIGVGSKIILMRMT